ncbi:MAG TPA: toll/interleukin-1 receptor domain-containing protein [Thermoanaerobaculia bacterium]
MGIYNSDWDVFISYASEDRESVARPLAHRLRHMGLRVWFDEFALVPGSSLTQSINGGIARSKFGVVILSAAFLEKEWPQRELHGLFARDRLSSKVLIPVWHEIDEENLLSTYPILADRMALKTSEGIDQLAEAIIKSINLPFFGDRVAGLWTGDTGRLRIFEAKDGVYEGDYDWNGHEWSGHLQGRMEDKVFVFDWFWDLSDERGRGFFVGMPGRPTYSGPEYWLLSGGWTFSAYESALDRVIERIAESEEDIIFSLRFGENLHALPQGINLWSFRIQRQEYDGWSIEWVSESKD